MIKKFLFIVLPFLISVNANALFELRAGYGIQTPADTSYGTGTLKTMTGFNLDAIVELPMMPLGIGLRYEDMGFDYEVSGVAASSSMTRASLLVNYRLIDLFTYFGLIGTIGFSNEAEADLTGVPLASGIASYKADLTYSVGVEGGLSFGLFMVGAELGYLAANMEADSPSTSPDLDLSGVYMKALVGVGF